MNQAADIALMNDKLHVSGDLNFFNVMSVFNKSMTYFKTQNKIEINFAAVSSSDSSGLALIIEWMKYADKTNKPIRFDNLPAELLSIAKAAKLDDLILSKTL